MPIGVIERIFFEWLNKASFGGTIMSERVVNLTTVKELEQASAQSIDRPVFIYKHSSVCSISSGTYQIFHEMADMQNLPSNPFFTQIMVIENREISDEAVPMWEVEHGDRFALVMGGEKHGLSQSTIAACDVIAQIPMSAHVPSINVGVASAVALYEFLRRDSLNNR